MILLASLLCAFTVVPILAYKVAPRLLWVDSPGRLSDMIVIAGGNGPFRVPVAIEVAHHGFANKFLVTGGEEWEGNIKLLTRKGIRPDQILAETVSRSTAENASMGVKILRQQKVKKAIIVTSWYHSRRTLSCFQHYAPEIEFLTISVPSQATEPYKVKVVLLEYLKIIFYVFRFGISPFPQHPPVSLAASNPAAK
ncbi:MAG: hypothetical protein JWN25_227 [Verrucomicrobiales bacterium]|nr:hypothetical protein [Verrucomicrobiales bacterium]MDB6129240.1 hypothetical protein [Verrucomicrobiales bacterium]